MRVHCYFSYENTFSFVKKISLRAWKVTTHFLIAENFVVSHLLITACKDTMDVYGKFCCKICAPPPKKCYICRPPPLHPRYVTTIGYTWYGLQVYIGLYHVRGGCRIFERGAGVQLFLDSKQKGGPGGKGFSFGPNVNIYGQNWGPDPMDTTISYSIARVHQIAWHPWWNSVYDTGSSCSRITVDDSISRNS